MAADILPYYNFLRRRILQERQKFNTMGAMMTNPQRTRAIQHIINLETRYRMQMQIGEFWMEPGETCPKPQLVPK